MFADGWDDARSVQRVASWLFIYNFLTYSFVSIAGLNCVLIPPSCTCIVSTCFIPSPSFFATPSPHVPSFWQPKSKNSPENWSTSSELLTWLSTGTSVIWTQVQRLLLDNNFPSFTLSLAILTCVSLKMVSNTPNKLKSWFRMKTSYCRHWALMLPLTTLTLKCSSVASIFFEVSLDWLPVPLFSVFTLSVWITLGLCDLWFVIWVICPIEEHQQIICWN